eukprot:4976147-Amphidinium_carterae.1
MEESWSNVNVHYCLPMLDDAVLLGSCVYGVGGLTRWYDVFAKAQDKEGWKEWVLSPIRESGAFHVLPQKLAVISKLSITVEA